MFCKDIVETSRNGVYAVLNMSHGVGLNPCVWFWALESCETNFTKGKPGFETTIHVYIVELSQL